MDFLIAPYGVTPIGVVRQWAAGRKRQDEIIAELDLCLDPAERKKEEVHRLGRATPRTFWLLPRPGNVLIPPSLVPPWQADIAASDLCLDPRVRCEQAELALCCTRTSPPRTEIALAPLNEAAFLVFVSGTRDRLIRASAEMTWVSVRRGRHLQL